MKQRPAAINSIWFFLILISIIVASYTGTMGEVTRVSFDAAKNAVTLALSLIGAMALWLGIVKVAEEAGLTLMIARAIRPVMTRLFPDVPAEHPAMSAMIMNMAANMLGLGNAATPFGIKAMTELDRLNPEKGTATNAMCLFLAMNTSSVTILPLGVIAVRAAAGASQPASILVPGLIATITSTAAAIIATKLFARRVRSEPPPLTDTKTTDTTTGKPELHDAPAPIGLAAKIVLWCSLAAFLGAIPYHFITHGTMPHLSFGLLTKGTEWLVPALMGGLLFFGYFRGVRVYEAVTEGAKEGFQVAIRIIPFMVAIFVAIGMFRESGALALFSRIAAPVTAFLGVPTETLPLAFMRPLSGTGSFAVMSEIVNRAPDGFASFVASVMQGSTETTFYVLAVYFGAVGVHRTRHALSAALVADAVGLCMAVLISHLMFGLFR
ncbi:MAG: hypothetical protein JW913_15250 [Chitinispirillaceae bacterium]|nr:hypothetical protein [Chitinispirillaceae bacterium]